MVWISDMKLIEQDQIVMDQLCFMPFINPTWNIKMKCYLIPYHSDDVNNNRLEILQSLPVCTSSIMAICKIGDSRWTQILGHTKNSLVSKYHGNHQNAKEEIKAVDEMSEVIATNTLQELTQEIMLRDSSDTKKYYHHG